MTKAGGMLSVAWHQADGAFDGTTKMVARVSQRNGVAFALVLLGCEAKTHPRSSPDIPQGGGNKIEMLLPHMQPDIIECERGVIVGSTSTFARPQQKEERQADRVRKGQLCRGSGSCQVRKFKQECDKCDWCGSCSFWWGVNFGPASKLLAQPEVKFVVLRQSGIPLPHPERTPGPPNTGRLMLCQLEQAVCWGMWCHRGRVDQRLGGRGSDCDGGGMGQFQSLGSGSAKLANGCPQCVQFVG